MTSRALVVAVPRPRFASLGRLPDLPGVTGDARAIADRLHRSAFDEVTVHDHGLGVAAMKAALHGLRLATAAGDLAFVYFSGHGFRRRDAAVGADEDDGWDECLVLDDDVLVDDWFRTALWPFVAPDTRWVTVADACFSASMFRGLGEDRGAADVTRLPARGSWRLDLGACQDDRRAFAFDEADAGYGLARSYATRALLDRLAAAPGATYRQLWTAVDEAARAYWRRNADVGTPTLYYSATDDRLLDSPAFAPLTW